MDRLLLTARGDEVADLARDFDDMTARLEQLMAAQIRMIGDISHEPRSPLACLQVALHRSGGGLTVTTRLPLAAAMDRGE